MKHSAIRKETRQMKGKELLLHMGFILKDFPPVKLLSNKVPGSPADNGTTRVEWMFSRRMTMRVQ